MRQFHFSGDCSGVDFILIEVLEIPLHSDMSNYLSAHLVGTRNHCEDI